MRIERIPWPGDGPPDSEELRQQLEQEGYEAFQWHDQAGADYQPHSHDHDESLWVIDGEIAFGIAGKQYALGPGDRLMLPKGTVHTAHAGKRGATYWIGERRAGR